MYVKSIRLPPILLIIIISVLWSKSEYNVTAALQRIHGGENARIQEYPYQVSIRWIYGSPQPQHFCGGSILDKNHIITAAHCIMDKRKPQLMRFIRIYTGSSRTDVSSGGKPHGVKSIVVHPGYVGASNAYLNDIAILTLSESIEFNASQQPIKLPTRNPQTGQVAVVTGWGVTAYSQGEIPLNLQKAPMKIIASKDCQFSIRHRISNTQVCALVRIGVGVCSGDSGGPLVSNDELIGIASYVMGCAKGSPDVYTNVYSFVDFIKQHISQQFNSNNNGC